MTMMVRKMTTMMPLSGMTTTTIRTLGGLPLGFLTTVLVFSPSSFLSCSCGLEAGPFLACLEAEAEGVTVSLVEVVASLAGLQVNSEGWKIRIL